MTASKILDYKLPVTTNNLQVEKTLLLHITWRPAQGGQVQGKWP